MSSCIYVTLKLCILNNIIKYGIAVISIWSRKCLAGHLWSEVNKFLGTTVCIASRHSFFHQSCFSLTLRWLHNTLCSWLPLRKQTNLIQCNKYNNMSLLSLLICCLYAYAWVSRQFDLVFKTCFLCVQKYVRKVGLGRLPTTLIPAVGGWWLLAMSSSWSQTLRSKSGLRHFIVY